MTIILNILFEILSMIPCGIAEKHCFDDAPSRYKSVTCFTDKENNFKGVDDPTPSRCFNVKTELQNLDTSICQQIQKSMCKNFSVCLFNVRTSGNIGMIIRSACILGCKQVFLCGRKRYDRRFTVGSENYIPVIYHEDPLTVTINCVKGTIPTEYVEILDYSPDDFISMCENQTPVFIEQNGTDIRDVCFKSIPNPILIFGNESFGIPADFIKIIKKRIPQTSVVSIPQYSVLRSMNVSMAASIAIWEVTKQL